MCSSDLGPSRPKEASPVRVSRIGTGRKRRPQRADLRVRREAERPATSPERFGAEAAGAPVNGGIRSTGAARASACGARSSNRGFGRGADFRIGTAASAVVRVRTDQDSGFGRCPGPPDQEGGFGRSSDPDRVVTRFRSGSRSGIRTAASRPQVGSETDRDSGLTAGVRSAGSRGGFTAAVGSGTGRNHGFGRGSVRDQDGGFKAAGQVRNGSGQRLRPVSGPPDQESGFTAAARIWNGSERRLRPGFGSGIRTAASRPQVGSETGLSSGFTAEVQVRRSGRRLHGRKVGSGRIWRAASPPRFRSQVKS